MGFGILLIGYLLFFPVCIGFFYTLPVATVFFALAEWKLARVNRPFGYGFYGAILLGLSGILAIVLRLVPGTQTIASYAEAACLLIALVWHCLTLTGMEWVTEETGLKKLRVKAFRNRVYSCIYLILAALLTAFDGSVLSDSAAKFLGGAYIAVIAVGLVVLFLNALLIWHAYAGICMPEDVDMHRKPSHFGFVNDARARADAKEAAAREESLKKQAAYREKRLAQWEAGIQSEKGKKK